MKRRLNIGILAHVDAGKTTLSEALLYISGQRRRLGRVDHGDAFLDTDSLEKKRGITIFSKMARFGVGDLEITLLDTPGHVDFSAEMERTLQVLDYAILVISAADGIQSHTRTLWKLLAMHRIPVFLFINKMDQPSADRDRLMKQLKAQLDGNCIDYGLESDEELRLEETALCEEALLESYMAGRPVTDSVIADLIEERKLFPCYYGSALKMFGVRELLKGIENYAKMPEYPDEFGARVYKISRDDKGERLTFLKVTGGSLAVKDNPSGEGKVNQIRLYSGEKYEMAGQVPAGCVCAVTGLADSSAGQGLGIEEGTSEPVLLPVLSHQVIPPAGTDRSKLYAQLRQLEEEEPLLHVSWDSHTDEISLQLMGQVQIEIIKSQIEDRFGIDVTFGPSRILYKETIAQPVIGIGHYEPLRHYAEVHLLLEPLEEGAGLVYATDCKEDKLDRNWQRLILTHMMECEHPGVLTGSPVTDLKMTLIAGRAHLKHTEGGDFRQATYRAIRQGLMSAKSVLLEPWYEYTLRIPSDQIGRGMADIQRMSGTIDSDRTLVEEEMTTLFGEAPASEIMEYPSEVLAYTSGRGQIAFAMKGYRPCHNEEEVLDQAGYDSERDADHPSGSIFCSHGAGYYVPWDQVPALAHIKDQEMAPRYQKEDQKTVAGRSAVYAEDAAFQAIYQREFGKSLQERDNYSGYRKKTLSYGERKTEPARQRKKEEKKKEYLLVDGYNIIFAWDELKGLGQESLEGARYKLMDILSNYQGFVGIQIILVFDAYHVKGNPGEIFQYHNIYVVFTKEAETADQYIEKTTHEMAGRYDVTVATSDGLEQVIVMGQGARRLSATDFHEEVRIVEEQIREINRKKYGEGRNYLFDTLDEEFADQLNDVRLGRRKTIDKGGE